MVVLYTVGRLPSTLINTLASPPLGEAVLFFCLLGADMSGSHMLPFPARCGRCVGAARAVLSAKSG